MLDYHSNIEAPEKFKYEESKDLEAITTEVELKKVCKCVAVTYWDSETRYFNLKWWLVLREGLLKNRDSKKFIKAYGKTIIKFSKN